MSGMPSKGGPSCLRALQKGNLFGKAGKVRTPLKQLRRLLGPMRGIILLAFRPRSVSVGSRLSS